MTKTPNALKTSTAILLALSLGQPMPVAAQEALPEGAICADGAQPPCAEGVELILPDEPAAEEPAAEDPAAEEPAAEDPAAEEPAAAEPEPEAPRQPEATAPEDTPRAEEPLAEEPPAGEPAAEERAAPEPAAPEAEAPTEDAAAEEPPAGEPAAEERAAPEPAAPEAEAPTEDAVAEESPAGEPAAEAPASGATSGGREPAAEESAAEDPAVETPRPTEEAPAEEAPADEAPTEEAPAGEAPTEEAPAGEAPAEEAPAEDAGAEAPASVAETAPAAEAPLVIPGAEGRVEEARRVIEALGLADPAAGAGEAPTAAAAAADAAEAEATVETEITEADTRQSSEDFATTASGAVRAGAGDGGGLSDFEKAALVGLGILAVGAILANGDEVVANTGDRVVMRREGDDYYVLKDDDALLRQPGATVRTESFNDGSTRTTVTREDGSRIITIRDASGRVLRRVREDADGHQVLLIDDTETYAPVVVEQLPAPAPSEVSLDETDPLALRLALERAARDAGRSFSLRQVREIERVRKLVPEIAFDPVTFASGSAAIEPSEAEELLRLGDLMVALIGDNPGEVFLIEGHTDAVGAAAFNLALSDRRAESVALALTEYFAVPPENMVVQGYGESDLKIDTLEDERANRRVTVRRITPLLDQRLARN